MSNKTKNTLPKRGTAIILSKSDREHFRRLRFENTIRQRKLNAMLMGSGAMTIQDRGAPQTYALWTMNPYFDINFFTRWQTYTRMYYTDWCVGKIIDIPVDDALRKPFQLVGIDDADAKALMHDYETLNMDTQFKRAMKQERLLGGSALFMAISDSQPDVSFPVNLEVLGQGDLKAINVIDIQKIWQEKMIWDPLDPEYDKPQVYSVNKFPIDISRLIVFTGQPLFNRATVNIYQLWRYNPAGFGESVLTKLFDQLVRVTGSQEGAYHLINMASVLLAKIKNLKVLGQDALDKISEIMKTISIFRSAMIDGDEAEFQQHTASFGSVPELVREFLQVLSGGCDIPATRFLGISPGGIGETGRSEHEDYYNSIDALQRLQIKPKMLKFFNIIGTCRFGLTDWLIKKEKFDIVYPPCWNLSEKEQAELNKTTVDYFLSLYDQRLMTEEQVIEELKQRNIFLTKFEFEQRLKDLQVEDLRLGGDEKGLDDLRKETGGDGITASHV